MKDLNLTRLIPVAAAGVFAVGCGGEEDPDAKEQITQFVEELCESQKDCDPVEFAEEFGSQKECVDYINDNLEEYYDIDDESCGEKMVEALECYMGAFDCNEYVYEACEDEFEEMYDACYIEGSGSEDTPTPVDDTSDGDGGSGDSSGESSGDITEEVPSEAEGR